MWRVKTAVYGQQGKKQIVKGGTMRANEPETLAEQLEELLMKVDDLESAFTDLENEFSQFRLDVLDDLRLIRMAFDQQNARTK
jgi:hypothetical protein